MIPILSYLIVIGLQLIAGWEIIKWLFNELLVKQKDGELIALLIAAIVFEIFIFGLFNWVLYSGGFYRLPWGW